MLHGEGFKWLAPPRPAVTSGCGTVRLHAHLLLSCHAGEKTSSKRHVYQMMFVWLPVSSGWRSGYDTVLMHRSIQGNSLYIPERFGRDSKLYKEVMRTWCFMAKIFLACHWHGPRSILTDCEVCGVQSVTGRCKSLMYGNISKRPPNSKWQTLYGCVDVFRVRLSTCMRTLVEMGHCMWKL